MLRIYLFGCPQIRNGEAPWPLPTPEKVMGLWAYLLLHRQQPLARDHLAYTLWPDVPEAEARANLRRHLYLLRKQLPPPPPDTPWIVATRHTVQWNPEADFWLDVALLGEFDETAANESAWLEVLKVYRGDLLEGSYDDWVLVECEHLHQRYIRLCERRIEQQRAAGDLQGAIATTRRLLAQDPLREEPYRCLMALYYQAGDRAAALREFERCEAMLRAELDAAPMPETLSLRQAILQDRELPTRPAPAPPTVLPAQDTPPPGGEEPSAPHPAPRPSRGRWLGLAALLVLALVLGAAAASVIPNAFDREPETISISGPEAVQDTWLNFAYPDLPYDPEYPDGLYALYPQVHLSYWNYPYDRVLVHFDLGQLPSGAAVKQALLRLHLEAFINEDLQEPRQATLSAFRILGPWEPETVTFNAPWSQPGLAPGLDYETEPQGSDSLHGSDWVDLDVTEAVRDWLAHPDQNFGLVVMITAAPQGAHYWVDTSDYPLPDRRPRLDITYIP